MSGESGRAGADAGTASAEARSASADPRSASLSPSARSESDELRGPATPAAAGARIEKAQDQLSAPGTSSRAKYAALVVGRPGLGALLKHELVISLAQARAGALGLVLRKMLYPALLGSCGRNVVFGQNVVLRHPHKIAIGSNVVIDDNCLIDAKGESNRGVRIGDGVFIGRNTILSCKNGDIELADGANIGFNCEVFSASRVTIGRSVLMAAYCYVIGGDHDFSDPSKPVLEQTRTSAGVTIGDGVWMGAGAKILDGVAIGDGAVIGAGAVVRENVPASAIAVGIPARVVSTR
jgi:acetyltransferase-like isoleucine patch superfamily enzyme